MTTIAKTFTFDAAHFLPGVPDDHKCRRTHGHTYEVTIVLQGPVDARTGMIVDYQDIANAWREIHDVIDHRLLNDIIGLENPTTELLAPWILHRLNRSAYLAGRGGGSLVKRVRVKESSTTWCEVTQADL
jgi:6-pyruvoyltetrahydropterin/6-carboxytetrahydropterin synthase